MHLCQPAPFLQNVGDPPIPFKAWIRSFENFLLAMAEEELPDTRKRALLIHCLGAEGQRLFYTLIVEIDTYAKVLEDIQELFTPKVNVVAERYRFRQRGQRAGETTDQFVAAFERASYNMPVWTNGRGDDTGQDRRKDNFTAHQEALTTGGTIDSN